jgi:hypothetical protein
MTIIVRTDIDLRPNQPAPILLRRYSGCVLARDADRRDILLRLSAATRVTRIVPVAILCCQLPVR